MTRKYYLHRLADLPIEHKTVTTERMAHKNKTNQSPYTARRAAAAASKLTGAAAAATKQPGAATSSGTASKRPGAGGGAGSRSTNGAMTGKSFDPRRAPASSTVNLPPRGPLLGKHKKPESIYSIEEANDRLADIFRNHDFACSHEERAQLAHFYRLLMENQEKENFTRLLKLRDIAIKHFIDCQIITTLTELKFPLLDVGTGPGFPGIPLKVHFPKEKIILAEGVQRRVEFLKHVRSEMKLRNLDIVGRNINKYFVYPVNGVITRAVEDIGNTLGNVMSCLQVGGRVYFMKGPGVDPEIPAAVKEYAEYYKLVKDIPYTLPHTPHQRRLVIFEKIKNAPIPENEDDEAMLLDELSGEEKRRWSKY